MYGLPSSYDSWKTACCGRYPHCNPCPYNEDDEFEEVDAEEEEEEDD